MTHPHSIQRAAVLGAGVMGAGIAAHLANAGLRVLLLDVKPEAPTEAEAAKGLTRDDREVSDRIVNAGLTRAIQARPPHFFTAGVRARIETGNLEDDLPRLAEVDWVVEAVTENLEVKRALYARVAPHLRADAILSSNTSGLSVAALGEAVPASRRGRFLATHFFNPPRYLKLLELVPGPTTDPAVLDAIAALGRERLGKGIVVAKDTPNFIANRVGVHAMMHAVHLMLEEGATVAEVDALTGPLIGRPKSATLRTADVVGLDTLVHVADNLVDRLEDDPAVGVIRPPGFVRTMVERGLLGEKSGAGFYRKSRTGGTRVIEMIDPETLDYVSQNEIAFASVAEHRKTPDLGVRLRELVSAEDRAGTFLWRNLSATMVYAASCIPEIADEVHAIDDAMRWGFGWSLGPFELWDTLGVARCAQRLARDGVELPPVVERVLDTKGGTFYRTEGAVVTAFVPGSGRHERVPTDPRQLRLAARVASGHVVLENQGAQALALTDDVLAVRFRTKMNVIDGSVIDLLEAALDRAAADFRGLVIGTDDEHFCAGADLSLIAGAITGGDHATIEDAVRRFQGLNQRLRFSPVPVVVATRGMVLGGGCEVLLAATHARAAAESYVGLVEVGAGVIPAGGGLKELLRRVDEAVPADLQIDLFPFVRRQFEMVGTARVSTSGPEAQELGFVPPGPVSMNADHVLDDARRMVVGLHAMGYEPPRPRTDIRVVGGPGLAALRSGMVNLHAGRRITDYDRVVGDHLAQVLCGGDISGPARVSEEYLLTLEREAFVALCRDPRTLARIESLLTTGKPLRN
jgi:3-hydroxyacyl-CoA dehydrogenase